MVVILNHQKEVRKVNKKLKKRKVRSNGEYIRSIKVL